MPVRLVLSQWDALINQMKASRGLKIYV